MTGFAAEWLALRAAADVRARDAGLAARLVEHFAKAKELRVLDLGAGSGANLRATAPSIAAAQHWVLADNDPLLLTRAEAPSGVFVERREADLATALPSLLSPPPELITASAFLDLCGAAWLGRLADAVVTSRAVIYTVLSYDGREVWRPPHALDATVLSAFHVDQRHDKGLGPALGPEAHADLAARMRDAGWRVFEAASDWELAQPEDAALIGALAEGSAAAVRGSIGTLAAAEWRAARIDAARVTVGHRDLLALPPA